MKNIFKLLGIVALVAVIGFGFTACGDDNGGGNGGANSFVGTWVEADDGVEIVALAAGTFTIRIDGDAFIRGTWTQSGNNVTGTLTEINIGLFMGEGTQWVDIDEEILEMLEDEMGVTAAISITITGNTFTMGGQTFTRQ